MFCVVEGLQCPGCVSWLVVWGAWALCFCGCVAFLRGGGVGLSLAGGLEAGDSGNRCAPVGCETCCRCCMVGPRCWGLGGGGVEGGGDLRLAK